jgi:putative Mg2+ transporter-C (MgtC) family protein
MVLQADPGGHIHFTTWEQLVIGGPAAKRLLMACAMGGAVGIEREWRHKDSGLRTNMLICMASALFTIMSVVLAGDSTPNKGQVAANIVQGIGFLGAGLILHTKNRVLGLTSAATVFVVAERDCISSLCLRPYCCSCRCRPLERWRPSLVGSAIP